jgi:hypothetical protein
MYSPGEFMLERPMDIVLLRRGVADQAALVRLVEQCAAISDPDDGVIFEPTTISVEPIRDASEYVGTRVRLQACLGNLFGDNGSSLGSINAGGNSSRESRAGAWDRVPSRISPSMSPSHRTSTP